MRFRVNADNTLNIFGASSAGTTLLDIGTDDALTPGWHHVLVSADMTNAANRHVYIDDIAADFTVATYTNGSLNFAAADWGIAADASGGSPLEGAIAELWLEDTYLDLSVEVNRRKFISTNGRPAVLGADGSAPTGGSPLIYLSGNDGDFATNKGTGGGFTENGSLAAESVFYSGSGFPAGVVMQLKDGTTLTAEVDETDESATATFTSPQALPSYLTNQGAWTTSTAYAIDDVVTNGGESYSCTVAHTSSSANEPDVGASWFDVWEPLLRDCLIASGPFSRVDKRMIVLGIKPQDDLSASVTVIDEAAKPFLTGQGGVDDIYAPDGSRIRTPF